MIEKHRETDTTPSVTLGKTEGLYDAHKIRMEAEMFDTLDWSSLGELILKHFVRDLGWIY